MLGTVKARWVITTVVLFSVVVSRSKQIDASSDKRLVTLGAYSGGEQEKPTEEASGKLEYDFYKESCPEAENIVRTKMTWIYRQHRNVSAQLLRLFFHDCFIQGCDASVLLDDSNGNTNHSIEKQAIPNKSLKGFDKIDQIKEELENVCPGVVSCADILALATRDGVILAGGPYYPVLTGRRDSTESYFDVAMEEIPKPDDNITQILHLFSSRGFSESETVALLGAHNIGKIGCEFIESRVNNFTGTGQPDPALPTDLLSTLKLKCVNNANKATSSNSDASQSSLFISSGAVFDSHYYQNLMRGRGILFSDQQLMVNMRTAQVVAGFAYNGTAFRMDFAQAMTKMSKLGVLTGSQGQVRSVCSLPVDYY
ncbi:putative Peroxidase 48 [Argentina anserina]|uniref:putative Peroxidase 48 n=1 Tax=Argentina anserina TaxID=57926 RepID=UPI0021763185|nr:putative Peroxidase 48 [Potentilla anserina]